jgi:hypothetical protein
MSERTQRNIKLHRLLTVHFDEEELRTLCFHLGVDYNDLGGEGKTGKARELVLYLERQGRLEELEEYLNERFPDQVIEDSGLGPPHVPFTNREDDIDRILFPFAPPYFLLDAPAGYGKTELLKELERHFQHQEWVCTYVSTGKCETLQDLTRELAQGLDVSLTLVPDARRLGGKLAGALMSARASDIIQGVALLIDLGAKYPLLIEEGLLDEFIPGVHKNLQGLEVFKTQQNRFRVVLAGRHLASQIKARPIPLAVRKLTPFDYKVVQNTVRNYLAQYGDFVEAWISGLAAHLMYLTGGHPGCMARVLEMYVWEDGILHPDDFLCDRSEEIWEKVVRPVSDAIRNGIPRHLRTSLDELSVFRYLDYGILRRLIKGNKDLTQIYEHENEMADELTANYLLDWKSRLLRDDITRRLLAIRLRYEISSDEFASRCEQAQNVCAEYLKGLTTQMPEMWTIEYLYQSLQRYARQIPQERESARQALFGDKAMKKKGALQEALEWLVDGRDANVEKMALKQALEADWEFRFTVNYFLRQDEYSDEPYEELQREIDGFFSKRLERAGGNNG